MPIHNYKCERCEWVSDDLFSKPDECSVCKDNKFSIYFGHWDSVKLRNNGHCLDDRVDGKGRIQKFTVSDDPLCKRELSPDDGKGIKSFSREQTKTFQEKLVRDGDSATLRREILNTRNANLGNKRQASWE